MYQNLLKVQFLILVAVHLCNCHTPVVIWHGIVGTCCNGTVTGRLATDLINYLPGIHILNVQIGNSETEDYWNSILMHPDKQIEAVCNMIKSDPLLAGGYNAIGFSQGSQFLRGVAQRCPEPRMKNLVTLAGQHQGVYGVPFCNVTILVCDILRRVIDELVYLEVFQKMLTPAAYWHNPLDENDYVQGNTFLSDINNERHINQTYIKNLQSLERLIMVKFEADRVVQPLETQWFGFYKSGQSKAVQSLRESDLYTSDRLGLKQMDIDGKLHFLSTTWTHAEFHWDWFKENIVDKYLI